ncbi:MAG TPA: hypothetical protein VMD06_03210 [Steroidobacteraceae bacterium]|nr:hypothetical protein [Steroidobacteraceae bacterium]
MHTGTPEDSVVTAKGLRDLGLARTIPLAEINRLVRSTLAPGLVPRSAPCLPIADELTGPAEEMDRWELIERSYREHTARRVLEELFAAGEMGPFGD